MGSSDDVHIEQFVLKLLGTGFMLSQLVEDLTDALPPDAYPGEEPQDVVFEMLCGTIATALVSVESAEVVRATELIDWAAERTIEHLRLAQGLARRMHGDGQGAGRNYG